MTRLRESQAMHNSNENQFGGASVCDLTEKERERKEIEWRKPKEGNAKLKPCGVKDEARSEPKALAFFGWVLREAVARAR